MTTQTFTIFMFLKATREWLDFEPDVRFSFIKEQVRPILDSYPSVSMRFFDTESYSAKISDIVTWETSDLSAFQGVIRGLRSTSFWDRYFEVIEIIPSVEDGYATHYGIAPLTSAVE